MYFLVLVSGLLIMLTSTGKKVGPQHSAFHGPHHKESNDRWKKKQTRWKREDDEWWCVIAWRWWGRWWWTGDGACMVLPDPTHRETKSQDAWIWNYDAIYVWSMDRDNTWVLLMTEETDMHGMHADKSPLYKSSVSTVVPPQQESGWLPSAF